MSLGALAQKTYTLKQCIDLALENNIKVRSAILSEKEAQERKREMFTSFFPQIDVSAGAYMMNRYTIDIEIFDIPLLQYLKNGNYAMVNAIQPIYAGGRLLNGNRLAKLGVDVSRLEKKKSIDEVRLTTESYYFEIVSIKSKLQTISVLDSMLERLHKDVQVAIKAGVKMQNDLLQVELKQNEVSLDRIKLEHGLATYKMLLSQFIGQEDVDVNEEVNIDNLPDFPTSLKVDHEAALINTSDYQLLEKNVQASTINKRLEVGKNLPQVGIGAGLFTHDILDTRQNRGIIYASVAVPISSWWGGSHAIKRMKMAEQQAKQQLEDDSQLLLIEMQNSWNDVVEAYDQLTVAKKSILQSKENLRLNNNGYLSGTIPLSDLLQAQSFFQEALDNYTQALTSYYKSISKYKVATSQE